MNDWISRLKRRRMWPQRWKRVSETSGPPTIFQLEATATPRVPAEYRSLYYYLEYRYASTVVLTFAQMEALLGFALPASASAEPEWWVGTAVPTRRHSTAWTEAKRTACPNLMARTVTFERQLR